MDKIAVGVLGATGAVGQRFVQLLSGHPWFDLVGVTGSGRTQGMSYGEACHWVLSEPMPGPAAALPVLPSDPGRLDVPLLFSALPSSHAREIEPLFSRAGKIVCSNASAFREERDVPILLPEVNPGHATLIETQRTVRGWSGAIVTNPNCTSAGMTIVLHALNQRFGVDRVFAVSMQAVSGAGYPGVSAFDIHDNVIPVVSGEEDKVEWEPRKMLGALAGGELEGADILISAHTNRVPVVDGHLVCLSVGLRERAGEEAVVDCLGRFRLPPESAGLPSSPDPVIRVHTLPDRPQPRLDRMDGGGMTTGVGRIRPDALLDYRMVVLSHNTIRGAAGGSIYNAELLKNLGML